MPLVASDDKGESVNNIDTAVEALTPVSTFGNEVPLFSGRKLTKIFGGTIALQDVDIDVHRGEVVAVVGENGAGKSTLKNLLVGLFPPDMGTIELNGERIGSFKAADYGIAAVHQEFSLFGSLSIAENICINDFPGRSLRINWPETRDVAEQYLAKVATDMDPDTPVDKLSTGEQQMVEIAKALRQASNLLILDEPTASLTEPERDQLFEVISNLRAQGLGMIFISHFIDEVYEVADTIMVLRDGKRVGGSPASEMPRRTLQELMVGRPISERQVDTGDPREAIALRVENLNSEDVSNISLEVHEGAIVGLAGLMGAGRTELVEAIYGLRPSSGKIWVGDTLVERPSPPLMKKLGVALVPEDRRRHGLFGIRPLRENLSAAAIDKLVQRRIPGIGFRGEAQSTAQIVDTLRIANPGLEEPVDDLSGGNQQKSLLGRWLAIEPRVCILDDSTRGVDIGAKEEIHNLIGQLSKEGVAVLLVSSELPELIQLAHRIVVLRKGEIAAEIPRSAFDPRLIIQYAASAVEDSDDNI
ncbi:MAG: sugar ABC transporter ATP-binding protein [Chloroflexota bacterium]